MPLLPHPLLDPAPVDLLLYLLLTILDPLFDTLATFVHLILYSLLRPIPDSAGRSGETRAAAGRVVNSLFILLFRGDSPISRAFPRHPRPKRLHAIRRAPSFLLYPATISGPCGQRTSAPLLGRTEE